MLLKLKCTIIHLLCLIVLIFHCRELDRDCDGRVSYKDFDFMMKYNTTEHL